MSYAFRYHSHSIATQCLSERHKRRNGRISKTVELVIWPQRNHQKKKVPKMAQHESGLRIAFSSLRFHQVPQTSSNSIVHMSWLLSVVEAQTRKCPHFQRKMGVHPRPGGRPRGGNIEHSVLQTDALTAPMRQSATVCDSQLHCRALCRIALRRVRVLRIESPVQGGPPNDADKNNDTCVAAPVAGGTLNTESSSRQCPAGASGASAQDRESCPGGTPQRSRQK